MLLEADRSWHVRASRPFGAAAMHDEQTSHRTRIPAWVILLVAIVALAIATAAMTATLMGRATNPVVGSMMSGQQGIGMFGGPGPRTVTAQNRGMPASSSARRQGRGSSRSSPGLATPSVRRTSRSFAARPSGSW
jgi:hypothetical protein